MWRENAMGAAGTGDGPGGRSASWRSTLACSASALAARVSSTSERSPAISPCLGLSRLISAYLGFFPKKSLPESEMTGPLSPHFSPR